MSHDHHLADDEIVALLEQMFEEYDIGFTGIINNNGADSYFCPCCFADHPIKGNALGRSHIISYDHAEDCNAWKLYQMLQEEEPDHEAIIALTEEMLDNGEIGLIYNSNSNGADYYECPSCLTNTNVVGYGCGLNPLINGEHKKDCNAMKLYQAIQERIRQQD